MFKNKFSRNLLWILLIYSSTTLIVMFVSDYLIFPAPEPSYSKNDDRFFPITHKNTSIMASYMPLTGAKYTILFSHGNAQDLGRVQPILEQFNKHGFSAFSYDYQGYGHSTGSASEPNAKQDIRTAYNYLTNVLNIKPEQIILYGYSLGSGVTIDLAQEVQVGGIIVEGAFTSTYRTKVPIKIFPVDRFDSYAIVSKIKQPILYLHGEDDKVIPVSHSYDLYERTLSERDILTFADHQHKSLPLKNSEKYWDKVKNWVQNVVNKQGEDNGNRGKTK